MTITIEGIHNHPSDDNIKRKNIFLNIDGNSTAFVINYEHGTTSCFDFSKDGMAKINVLRCIVECDYNNPQEFVDRFMKLLVLK